MKQAFALIALAILCTSCSGWLSKVDCFTFKSFGGTLFSSPSQVSMKEIHLDNSTLLGQQIIVEGTVVNIGEYSTHLVISDENARMLVVLTNLVDAEQFLKVKNPKMLRVLGTVERGKKGMPFVMARALSPMEVPRS